MVDDNFEEIMVGSKPVASYLTAGLVALSKNKNIKLLGRGNNIKRTVDVAEIIRRQMDNPQCEVMIGSEDFENRKVSIIEIKLIGKKGK